MGFLFLLILIWGVSMGAWFVVSKYVKSSDVDRIKARLSGTTKAKSKKKTSDPSQASVIQSDEAPKNKFANMLVQRYGFGPKLGAYLEQAGVQWQPARFVHLSLVAFLAGFGAAWMLLPFGKPLSF